MSNYFAFPVDEVLRLKDRIWIFDYIPRKQMTAIEFGVFRGHFSEIICHILKPTKLYLVDPWTKVGTCFGYKGVEYNDFDKLTTSYAKEEAINRVRRFDNVNTIICEDFSHDFLKKIKTEINLGKHELIDFIYIDSTHEYESTYNELVLSNDVLAPGGIIAGDDWHYWHTHKHHGVFRAVHAFIKEYKYQIIAAGPGKQFVLRREISE